MQDLFAVAVQIVPTVSILIGIILFYFELRRSRMEKGYDTYVRTLLMLIDMEKMFIQYPALQNLWTNNDSYRELTAYNLSLVCPIVRSLRDSLYRIPS